VAVVLPRLLPDGTDRDKMIDKKDEVKRMDIKIEYGIAEDLDELAQLYDDLNDYLAEHINYPGWKKGLYPVRENAVNGIKARHLYTAKYNGKIVGSIILSHEPETAYREAKWQMENDYSKIFVIHTLVVHPEYINSGVGKKLMAFAQEEGLKQGMEAVRLDVYEKNAPAIHLYEKSGYQYISTVDLGLEEYGLKWFRLYKKLL
jgi:ribosomal protein S18 acetylase RimI-like enzyme